MKPIFAILCAILMLLGCANLKAFKSASKENETLIKNPRIVYRDLTKPKFYPVPQPQASSPESRATGKDAPANRPNCSVEFDNDSFKDFDATAVEAFAEKTPQDALIMVFGHSHGRSAVGTRDLATRRAEAISLYLRQKGFTNVHVMASWGGNSVPFCPTRGVQLYALSAGEESDMIQVAFSRTIEQEGVAENEDGPAVPVQDDLGAVRADAQHALADD